MLTPTAAIQTRIRNLIGATPAAFVRIDGGYTPALRWTFQAGGVRLFVKVATTPMTAGMLRSEVQAYINLRAGFMPDFVGWDDDPAHPLLIIEDLSDAVWPPPWTPDRVDQVRAQIAMMHRTPATLAPFAGLHGAHDGNWAAVAADPAPFLGLRLVTPAWLDLALPLLLTAEERCTTGGAALTHWDLRSDNICITSRGVKFVDWAEACLSNPELDLGFWLPSLAAEGGPSPEQILPDRPQVAAWVAGFFAARAGLPSIPDAPRVRQVQRQQLAPALAWAVHALDLPQPDAV